MECGSPPQQAALLSRMGNQSEGASLASQDLNPSLLKSTCGVQ